MVFSKSKNPVPIVNLELNAYSPASLYPALHP
jgi:hypothetical protein